MNYSKDFWFQKGLDPLKENNLPNTGDPRRWVNYRVFQQDLRSATRDALGAQETLEFPHKETNKAINALLEETEGSFEFIKDPFFRAHLNRMKATYQFWQFKIEPTKVKQIGWRGVLLRNLKEGPKYAEYLSKCLTYTYRDKVGVACYEFPKEYIDDAAWGYDYFPSPFHLLPYMGECDDYAVTYNRPTVHPSLKETFQELAEKYVRRINYDLFFDDADIISTLTNKAVMVGAWKTEPNLTARVKQGFPGCVTSYFRFKEKVIYKCPHEQRACWIPDVPTNNSIKLAKRIFQETLKSPADYYFRRPEWSELKEFLEASYDTYFIMSDLKKSGLTFPHHLVLWVKELIALKNQELDLSVLDGYSNNVVFKEDGKTIYEPMVGLGLGMGDPLISWVLSILFLIWKKTWNDEYVIKGMFWGDDQVIKVYPRIGKTMTQYDAAVLAKDWDRFQRKYGLVVHEYKPFVASTGCLLETYPDEIPGWDSLKRGQWVGSLFWALGCINIVQAKEYVNAVYNTLALYGTMLDLADRAVYEEIIPRWGYEFFPEEIQLPFEIGGWVRYVKDGLSQALLIATKLPLDKGGLARLPFVKKAKARGKKYPDIGDSAQRFLERGGPYFQEMSQRAIAPDYFKPSFLREKEVYRRYAEKRQKAFNDPKNPIEVLRENFFKFPRNCEIPAEFCLRDTVQRDRISTDLVPTWEWCLEQGSDPLRSRLFMDGILHNPDNPLVLSFNLKNVGMAQTAALRQIIGNAPVLIPSLFNWCKDDPGTYRRQLENLTQRGEMIHPHLCEQVKNCGLPFPILGKGDTLWQDPFTGAYALIDSSIQMDSCGSANTLWSVICRRPVGNIDLWDLRIPEPHEQVLEPEPPPQEPIVQDKQQLIDYAWWNIRGAAKAVLELQPSEDKVQKEEQALYLKYQVTGGYDEDFDLDDEGINLFGDDGG